MRGCLAGLAERGDTVQGAVFIIAACEERWRSQRQGSSQGQAAVTASTWRAVQGPGEQPKSEDSEGITGTGVWVNGSFPGQSLPMLGSMSCLGGRELPIPGGMQAGTA